MQEAIDQRTLPGEEADGLAAAALRAEAWAGEPFLRPDEDPAEALAEGRARRRALDDAVAEMDAGRRAPSSEWKIRYALMLGLERVLTDHPPRLASGTELRRHQIDALAGMLTELIARHEEEAENGNGNGHAVEDAEEDEEHEEATRGRRGASFAEREDPGRRAALPLPPPDRVRKDDRSGRLRRGRPDDGRPHPHAPPPARTTVHARPDHRGLRRPAPARRSRRARSRCAGNPITIQTYAWFARHVGSLSKSAYQLVICDEAHTALGEKTSAAIRSFAEPIYIGMTATEQLIAKQVSDVFPASVDDLPLADAARRG